MRRTRTLFFLMCTCVCSSIANASILYDITMNTTPLIGHSAGPFSVEFQLNDGSGTGDSNNTAILNDFLFNGGGPAGSPTLNGGANGNLTSGVTLTDHSFFNQFIQSFTPGSALSFRLSLSTNIDSGGTPDQFSFAILDKTGTELPTLAPGFFDVFVQIDIDSANPVVRTFGADTSRVPAGGGSAINIAAPVATPVVPEPSTILLFPASLVALLVWKRSQGVSREVCVGSVNGATGLRLRYAEQERNRLRGGHS